MKAEVESIIKQALVDGHDHEITSMEIIILSAEKIRSLYKPLITSLEESNKLVTNLQLEAQDLKIKIDFLMQELALKEN